MANPEKGCCATCFSCLDAFKIRHLAFIALIAITYLLFLEFILIPQAEGGDAGDRRWGPDATLIVTIVFHVIFGLNMISLARVCCADPGYLPHAPHITTGLRPRSPQSKSPWRSEKKWQLMDGKDWEKAREKLGVSTAVNNWVRELYTLDFCPSEEDLRMFRRVRLIERKYRELYRIRYCRTCQHFKPDRSHHCRQCKRCVRRMDHHCPYLNNCVGNHNYKYLVLTLFYGALCLLIIIGSAVSVLVHSLSAPPEDERGEEIYTVTVIWVLLFYTTLVEIALLQFFKFHVKITFEGITTIESSEKKDSDSKIVRHRFKICHAKYDRGPYGNFCVTMGPPYLWLLPVRCNFDPYDGYFLPEITDDERKELERYAENAIREARLSVSSERSSSVEIGDPLVSTSVPRYSLETPEDLKVASNKV